jgi:hypothetical protein
MARPASVAVLESFLLAEWQMMRAAITSMISAHVYENRPRQDKRGVDPFSFLTD